MTESPLVLVTGATGYIASRLIPCLLERGWRVRALAREPLRLRGRAWFHQIDVVRGDVMDPASLADTLQGVDSAYYLIHNMASGRGYTTLELDGARNFAAAAAAAGVKQIIYLGGLADPQEKIAAHMRSRIETGEVLRAGAVPVTEFRAGVIVGPGSISFEMIRFMTELFPVVPGPAWMKNKSQPIAARNVLEYLLAALATPPGRSRIFEIGGPDVLPYSELMLEYARLRGLKRRMVTFPGIPLWFMSLGVGLTTPVPRRIAHALIDGLRSNSFVVESGAQQAFSSVGLIPFREAVTAALAELHPDRLEPVWTDGRRAVVSLKHEGFFIDHRFLQVEAAPEDVFQALTSLGGKRGWLFANWLWKLRGWLGGNTARHGANSALAVGALLDFYRIEALEPGRRLLLHSELNDPGANWLEWRMEPGGQGHTLLTQTAYFAPRGLPGFLFWYLLYPVQIYVFNGLLRAIARMVQFQPKTK